MSQNSSKHSILWTLAIVAVVLSVGIALALYVQKTTTQIRKALAEEVLEQQSDVALLIYEYSKVMLAVEKELQDPQNELAPVINALTEANLQLHRMRFQYSFERLDGAATAHATAKPALEDVYQWLVYGIPGVDRDVNSLLAISSIRLSERYDKLRLIDTETNVVATALIADQSNYLDEFRSSLILFLGAYSMLALAIAALLIRQKNLQTSLANEQHQNAERFADFADVGADWLWETDSELRLLDPVKKPAIPIWVDAESENTTLFSPPPNSDSSVDTAKIAANQPHWPIDSMRTHERFTDVEKQWAEVSDETRVISLSGKPILDAAGNFQGYRGIGRDITERKRIEAELHQADQLLIQAETRGREQAEAALRGSEELLRTTLDSLPSEIAILENNGRIIAANNSWKAYTGGHGGNAEGGIGQHYLDVYGHGSELERVRIREISAEIQKVLDGEKDQLQHEYPCHEPDQQHWIVIRLVTFDAGEIRYSVLVREDVTERRQMEEQDRRLRAELAHGARLTTVGEMATGLAHELNQPLTAITHNCDALLSGLDDLPGDHSDVSHMADDIADQAQRAGGIIRSLRQLMRKDSVYTDTVELNQLVEETVRLTHPEARERGVHVRLNLSDNLPNPEIDPVQIQQVLVNLERNGVEAMSIAECTDKELIISTALDDENTIRVSVQDSGPGFSNEIREQLFTAFQTTKPDGMGLGLSISRSIVESHGGKLWLDANSAIGALFHFTLPITRG